MTPTDLTFLSQFIQQAVHHSIWIGTRVLSRASPEFVTPIEKATSHKPDLAGVLEWGILIWVKDLHAGKLNPRAKEGCFVGYDDKLKEYRVYWPGKNKVSVERNVYTNKKAILNPGNIVVEGEWEQVEKPGISKPKIPSKASETNNKPPKENSPIKSPTHPTDKPIDLSVTDSHAKT